MKTKVCCFIVLLFFASASPQKDTYFQDHYISVDEAIKQAETIEIISLRGEWEGEGGSIPELAKLFAHASKFKKLKALWIFFSNMRTISPKIRHMEKLEFFQLYETRVQAIPSYISELKRLKTVRLLSNGELHYIDGLCKIDSLKSLDMYGNSIGKLPSQFKNLSQLESLWMYDIPASELIPHLPYLKNLKKLRLNNATEIDKQKIRQLCPNVTIEFQ